MRIKLLFDQNLSYRLVSKLKESYPDSVHVEAMGLDKSSDRDVWKFAKDNGYVLVSKVEEALVKYKDKISSIIKENVTGIIEIK